MKRRHIFWAGFMMGAGLVAYFYEKRLKKEQYLAATRLHTVQQEKAKIQQALDKATHVPTPQEIATSTENAFRKAAWRSIPVWLTYDDEMRRNLILDTASVGATSVFPDAEMIAEYHRLKATGQLNPDDFEYPEDYVFDENGL